MGRRLKTYPVGVNVGTIPTTTAISGYAVVGKSGVVSAAFWSGVDALAASDTNFITWTLTNLGQAGAGSTAMLATTPAGVNTTKVTGGAAVVANGKANLTLAVAANLAVVEGDRLKLTATMTGTLANTVTFAHATILVDANGQ